MTDHIKTGHISDSEAIAIGRGATATVIHFPDTPPQFPLHNLPPPNPHFSGRQEYLAAIQSAFQNPQSEIVITQAIAGLGGVGKTQLALAYAHARQDAYDLIWLLRADDAAALDSELRRLGTMLRLPVQTADAAAARQMVLSWLNGAERRWLLLYDNVDEMDAGELRPFLPGGRGHLLITSRRPHWPRAQRLRLDVFTAAEAADFWPKRIEREIEIEEEDVLAELAAELGRLPLALEQAAAYMERRRKSAADYLRLYRQRRRALWQRQPPPDDYHATITTTWEMAFDHAQQTPGAADLLNLCCFLSPDDIPLDAVRAHAAALPDELAAVMADELARDDALAALTAYSLATAADGQLAVHRLVQAVARERMGAERAKTWAEAAVKLLSRAWPFDPQDMTTWEDCPTLLPHLMAAAGYAEENEVYTEQAAALNGKITFYLGFFGDNRAALPFSKRALAIFEKALGPDHPDTALSLNNLGYLLRAMGELAAARPYYERALAIRENALGADHPDTATSLNNLGALLRAMGELAAARPYYERALAIRENALGPDHPDTALSLNNLAILSYYEKDLSKAAQLMRRALAIWEKALGSHHPQTQSARETLSAIETALS